MDRFNSAPGITLYRYTFHFFLLALLIAIIYSNTLVQEWHFDDYPNIVENKVIHWNTISIYSVWKTIIPDGYGGNNLSRPIPLLTFALNYYFTGLNTLSYHLTNITIHIITAFFVYLVFQKTLMILKSRDETTFTKVTCQDIALLGAVLWAIHPLQTQAVTYIVQRMASMAAMFYIIAMFFYLQGRTNKGQINTLLFYAVAILCWILAVLSKENAVLLPLSVIIYELIFFGMTKRKIFYILSLLLLFTASVVFVLVYAKGNNSISMYEVYSTLEDKIVRPYGYRPFTMFERVLTEPRILMGYLFLIFCPISNFLTLESDITVSTGLFDPISTFLSIFSILTLIFLSFYWYKKIRIISFAILFFFINHVVESSIIGLELYFEHRNYLPSMFIYLSISYGFIRIYKYYRDNNRIIMHCLIAFFIVCIIVSEGNATYLRNDVWRTEETLHRDNLLKSPNNIRPRISLSSYYMRKGKFDEALDLLKGAELIVNSGKVRVQQNWIGLLYHNFGSVYYSKSEFNKSKIFLLKSLEYEQYSWETHILLGILFFKEGDFEQSANAYKNAITLRSVDPKLFNMLGRTLYALEDYGIALDVFHKGLELAQEQQKHDLVKTINFNIVSCYMALDDPVNARMTLSGMERYVDNIIFKYSLYIYDDIKPLQEIALYDDLIYLLYTSILKSEVKAQFLDKIAALIASSGKEYCDVINEIKDNNFLGIIYPPIAEIENDLSKLYYNKIKNSIEYMQDKMSHSQDCSFSKDLKEEVHNQN